jgi:hypothetical protein
MMGRRALAPIVMLLLLLAFALCVWPTRWRYDHMTVDGDIVPVRMDRLSGRADMLLPDHGWVPVEAPPDSLGDATPASF